MLERYKVGTMGLLIDIYPLVARDTGQVGPSSRSGFVHCRRKHRSFDLLHLKPAKEPRCDWLIQILTEQL